MEQPKKKLEDLTFEEALEYVNELTLRKKRIDVTIAGLKERKNKFKSEKKVIKDAKTKKLKSLQDVISKTDNKSARESKRKSKVRESESFDSRIASKDRQIESEENKILGHDKEKKQIDVVLERFKQHINKLKK